MKKDILYRQIEKILRKRRAHRQYAGILAVLAMITVLGVGWSLHGDGLAMTGSYLCGMEEHTHTDSCYTEELTCGQEESEEHEHSADCYSSVLTCDLPEHTHTEACLPAEEDEQDTAEPNDSEQDDSSDEVLTPDEPDEPYADADEYDSADSDSIADAQTEEDEENAASMSDQIKALTGAGTVYDANGDLYSTELKLEFDFAAGMVTSSGRSYYYEYPDGIIIPEGLLDSAPKDLLDSAGEKAGTYRFEKTDDGQYRVYVNFDEKYAEDHKNNAITGYVQFNGEIDGRKADDSGNIKIIGRDQVTLDIPKDEIKYPDNETNRYGINTSKQGRYTKDGKLVYTVYVDSIKGTPGDIAFEDVVKADGLTLGEPSVTVTKQTVTRYYQLNGSYYDDGNVQDNGKLDIDYTCNDGRLSMTLPEIESAKKIKESSSWLDYRLEYTRYKVEYTYDVSDLQAGTTVTARNEVTNTSTNGEVTVTETKTNDVTINNEYTAAKYGSYNAAEGYIEWTITLNSNKLDIAGAKLQDNMLAEMLETGFSISPDEGCTAERDAGGKIIGFKFNAIENGENHNRYIIKYRTPAKSTWNSSTVANTVAFTPAEGGKKESTATVTVPGSTVRKNCDGAVESADNTTAAVNWTVVISAPADGIPAGTVITDDPTQDQWGGKGGTQYRTRQQVIDWAKNISWVNSSGIPTGGNLSLIGGDIAEVRFAASDGSSYTWQEINANAGGKFENLTYTICTVALKQTLQPPVGAAYLRFKYATTADLGNTNPGANSYKNTITAGDKKADASYTYIKGGVVKTDENDQTGKTIKKNEDGALIWKIKATIGKESSALTFEDTLPNGVELTDLTGADSLNMLFVIEDGKITGVNPQYTATGSYTGNKVTVTLKPLNPVDKIQPSQVPYTLVLTCRVDKEALDDYEAGKTYTFENKATVRDESDWIGSASQTQDWSEDTEHEGTKIVDKSGKWNNHTRRAEYTIKLNPYGKDIVENAETLSLKDVFTYYAAIYGHAENDYSSQKEFELNAWLVPNSVKLYRGIPDGSGGLTKGEEITDWSWKVETQTNVNNSHNNTSTLTGINLPDSTPMILEYAYQFESAIPKGWLAEWMSVSNSAELSGTGYRDDQIQHDIKWGKQDSSAGVISERSGVLYKVSKGNYGKTLPGAVFKLQKYDDSSKAFADTDVTYTTGEDGKIIIRWQKADTDVQYEHNVLYRIVEAQAPEGYILPSDPNSSAFYFYFSSDTETVNTLPDLTAIAPKAADLSEKSDVVYVENESNTTSVKVNKKWLDKDGNVSAGHTGSIKVNLYRRESETLDKTTLSGCIRLGSTEEWAKVWKTFDETEYPAGTTISFTITTANQWIGGPDIFVNGEHLTPEQDGNAYTFTFALNSGKNIITGKTGGWNVGDQSISSLTVSEPSPGEDSGELVGTYDITSGEGWSKTFDNLPARSRNADGKIVYYTYYVKEIASGSYDVSYENNDGIVSGTITIVNKTSDEPSYELPETGGSGTWGFAAAGAVLMGAALLGGYVKRCRKRGIN